MQPAPTRWIKIILMPAVFSFLISQKASGQVNPVDSSFHPGDVIDNKKFLLKGFPDTLFIGAFTIIAEEYEGRGSWDAVTKTFSHLNGIGRISFDCPSDFDVAGLGNQWKDAAFHPVKVKIVDSVAETDHQISVRDAKLLGINAQSGSEVQLTLPHYSGKAIGLTRYLTDYIKGTKSSGIRVRFTDLTAKPTNQKGTKAQVLTGTAEYPLPSPFTEFPFILDISPGFKLEISAMRILTNGKARVTARLILPPSLAGDNDCIGATLNLGTFDISRQCEFYSGLLDSLYSDINVGNTMLNISGRGFIADFSSQFSDPHSGKPSRWKGVILFHGESKGIPGDSVVSNTGYMQADYSFSAGFIDQNGLNTTFNHSGKYRFGCSQPFGYTIEFNTAKVTVSSSRIFSGFLRNGTVTLPRTAVRHANDSIVNLTISELTIHPTMSISGSAVIEPSLGIYWGDFIKAGGGDRKSFGVEQVSRDVLLFFSAHPRKIFLPITPDGKNFSSPFTNLPNRPITTAQLDIFSVQGATFSSFSELIVNSRDIPTRWDPNDPQIPPHNNAVWFLLGSPRNNWLNVVTEGVHCHIVSDIKETHDPGLGDPSRPLYAGITPLQTKASNAAGKAFSSIVLQCVESSVIQCDFRSFIDLPKPTDSRFAFREMMFTSTADNAGGKLEIPNNTSLGYWGLELVQTPGYNSAGVISVRTGQIVITAAGLTESRHFTEAFRLTWGEILANGSAGRLFFDHNTAGQKFDGFNFLHNAVALSPFSTNPIDTPYLRVGGNIFFPFFAADYLHIRDLYVPSKLAAPFNKRLINLSRVAANPNFLPTDFSVAGTWRDGLAAFNFAIAYSDELQDGFTGLGMSGVRSLLGGAIGSTITLNTRGSCIRIGTDLMDQRSLALGPVANVSQITRIWGCACIINDDIENLVIGGEVTDAANFSIQARAGSFLSYVMQVTPSLMRITYDGEAYLSLALSLDALVSGHLQLTFNHAQGFAEGEVKGKFRVAGATLVAASALQGEGQLNWHFGADFEELQGMVSVKVMGFFEGREAVGAGFYIAVNAPKERAWILKESDPRYNLNIEVLPDNLTGIYGSVHIQRGANFFVIAGGGIDIYAGLGVFVLTPGQAASIPGAQPAVSEPVLLRPYAVGNLGGRIYGDILGGLVSASAYFNLQLIGPAPFSFEGSVGLEGCLLFACHSTDVTVGLNSKRGFYID